MNNDIKVTDSDVLKHYMSSIFVYGIVLGFVSICPIFYRTIEHTYFNYITVLASYYLLYVIFAYPVFMKLRPSSILNSRNVVILNYFKRQFVKNSSSEKSIKLISFTTEEKQAFIILFVKSFFSVITLNLLCNKFLPSLGYNLDFIKALFSQDFLYSGISFGESFAVFIDDAHDVILNILFTISSLILAFSYLTESRFFKNKIKYVDTSFLGIVSCIACYYPFIAITNQLLPTNIRDLMPIENPNVRLAIFLLVILVNFVATISVIRLGAKSGNLTNRGIVTTFPYNVVRHPEYSMQIFYIILTSIPVYMMDDISIIAKLLGTLGIAFWILLYYLRAVTEERNLIKDSDYSEYMDKVKYRFIPKLF